MTIPEKVKLNGVVYDIVWKDDLINEDKERLDGRINYSDNIIELNKSTQSYQGACRTLLHEFVHFIIEEHDIGQNIERIPQDEEALCELFSRSLYQIFEDNQLY